MSRIRKEIDDNNFAGDCMHATNSIAPRYGHYHLYVYLHCEWNRHQRQQQDEEGRSRKDGFIMSWCMWSRMSMITLPDLVQFLYYFQLQFLSSCHFSYYYWSHWSTKSATEELLLFGTQSVELRQKREEKAKLQNVKHHRNNFVELKLSCEWKSEVESLETDKIFIVLFVGELLSTQVLPYREGNSVWCV